MSNLTANYLKTDYGFEQTHSVHHNRSDVFLRYFVDRTAQMIPSAFFEGLLRYKPESERDARFFMDNQYPEWVGYHELHERKTSPDADFFSDLKNSNIDVILMDNFMDLAAKLMVCTSVPEYAESPLFLNPGFFENEQEINQMFEFWGDFLTPQQSAENFVRIYRFLRGLQPEAKFFFLPFHNSSSLTVPERFRRITEFYPALLAAAAGEDGLHIVPPLHVAPEHTKGEVDWPHFQPPLYRALAGYVYLATVGGLPNPGCLPQRG